MPLPAMPPPPAIVAPVPTAQDAEAALLEAFDWGRPLPPPPRLKGSAALAYRWLLSAATFEPTRGLPASPYATGRGHGEAEALHRLLKAPKDQRSAALKALTLRESGTALALWRWGQAQVKAGSFDPELRRAWEDRLLAKGPGLTRGYALRHGLCWALADHDEARFSDLRAKAAPEQAETLLSFQRLFGLLGGPSPVLRLWLLPGLAYQDLRLDQLGTASAWVCPQEEGGLQEIPAGTTWIIPSATGDLGDRDASLPAGLRAEGDDLAARLQSAGRSAWFAPSRTAFEQLGLAWFPILIELDPKGDIRAIRMGDAAPRRP